MKLGEVPGVHLRGVTRCHLFSSVSLASLPQGVGARVSVGHSRGWGRVHSVGSRVWCPENLCVGGEWR